MSNDTVTVIVRPVEPEDAAQLRENCFSANTLDEVQSQILENVAASEKGIRVHLVAEVDGVVVGTGVLSRSEGLFESHRGQIFSLVVHPHSQRRGIARRIVEGLRTYASSMELEFLEIGCRGGTAAEKVYPRLGFIEWGRFPRGLVEPWGDRAVFDAVCFYMPVRTE